MEVAYFFMSRMGTSQYYLRKILNDLELGLNTLEIKAMCFFDGNSEVLSPGNIFYDRLNKAAYENGIKLFKCSSTDISPGPSVVNDKSLPQISYRKPYEEAFISVENGVETGCFPDFYTAVALQREIRIIPV